MKQLLFPLLFLPCLALAQYPGNANQKITLGEQTTADGLVYRGEVADTTRKPSVDTMAYILLDTATNIIWQYKKATSNAWLRVGGSISSGLTGTLPLANGGTGASVKIFVDTFSNQTVNGVKTFNDSIVVNKGIKFPATQYSSNGPNNLDDYEEGTWTPIYRGLGGSIGSTAYSVQRGRYTKIGRFVQASGEITLTNKGSWSSGVEIAGLPFSTTAVEAAFGFIILGYVDFAADVKYCQFRGTGAANNQAYIDTIKDNLEREILFTTAINNNSTFEFQFIYTASN